VNQGLSGASQHARGTTMLDWTYVQRLKVRIDFRCGLPDGSER
jgi:hypothetical protein